MHRSLRIAMRRALTGALLCGLFAPAMASGGEAPPSLALDLQVAQIGAAQTPPRSAPGAMALSMKESIALALKGNLDIAIEGFTPQIREQDLLTEKSVYDPSAFLEALRTDNRLPATLNLLTGARVLNDLWDFNTGLRQKLPTGGAYELRFNNEFLRVPGSAGGRRLHQQARTDRHPAPPEELRVRGERNRYPDRHQQPVDLAGAAAAEGEQHHDAGPERLRGIGVCHREPGSAAPVAEAGARSDDAEQGPGAGRRGGAGRGDPGRGAGGRAGAGRDPGGEGGAGCGGQPQGHPEPPGVGGLGPGDSADVQPQLRRRSRSISRRPSGPPWTAGTSTRARSWTSRIASFRYAWRGTSCCRIWPWLGVSTPTGSGRDTEKTWTR